MAIPQQIQKQVEDVNKFMEAFKQPTEEEAQETASQPEAEVAESREGQEEQGEPQTETEQILSPEPQTEVETVQPNSEVDDLKEQLKKAEHRFNTLQGMYKADLRREIDRVKAELEAEFGAKQKAEKKDTAEPTSMADAIKGLVDEYGDGFVQALRVLAREEAQKVAPEAMKPYADQVEFMAQAQQQNALDRFVSDLSSSVPDWEQMNYDEGFMSWLGAQTVPYTNTPLATVLREAAANYDSKTTIQIFQDYKQQVAPTTPTTPPKPKPKPDVAPPASRTSAPPPTTPTEKKIWTQAEIRDLSNQYLRKAISKADYEKVQAEINQAIVDGRVR